MGSTNRGTGGDHYKRLHAALERLAGTRISTDIQTNGVRIKEGFGLIDRYRIVERSPLDERMIALNITLSEWFYNAILGREVLSISRDYFRLRKGIERRLYELARKHCGHQSKWKISLDLLHKKSGSSGVLREFRRMVKIIVKSQHLPDYRLHYSEKSDSVTFYTKESRGEQTQMKALLDGL